MPYFSDKEYNMIPEYLVKGACYFCLSVTIAKQAN